ncbi:MAG: hypothetical protein MJH10_07290, partial [Epibacterium sp.]|nr:hypothetical protein [Epibacterium sp.]
MHFNSCVTANKFAQWFDEPIFPKYFGLGVMLADLAIVFKLGVRLVCCGGGFAVLAGVLAKIS